MNYSFKDIHASLTPAKRRADSIITRYLLRPISVPVAWLFLKLGFTPNRVTAISVLCCITALILSFFPVLTHHIAAIVLFFIFSVLDCTDGAMARTLKKPNPFGDWVDAAGGYVAYIALPAAMANATALPGQGMLLIPGTTISFENISLFPGIWILIAFSSISANLLMRLLHQSFKNTELQMGVVRTPGKEKRLSEEIGITGLMPVLYAGGLATGTLPWVLLFYLAIYTSGLVMISIQFIRKIMITA